MHRLVGGHLHHSVYRKEENNFSSQSPSRLSKLYFRRKPWQTSTSTTLPTLYASTQPTMASSAAYSRATESISTPSPTTTTSNSEHVTTKEPVFIVEAQKYEDPEYEANQVINYEIKKEGFVESSAGEGRDEKKKEEKTKTLSDQVAEGKYGLIQNELFSTPPKRPGILSYATNSDTPNDNVDSLGGLRKDEIWLSEDHLLVLKGGSLNNEDRDEPWKPIDDYQAPLRQVKIPENPKIPPPFLVQLEENGPIEFIGNNQLPLVNPFTNESLLLFPEGGFPKTETYSGDKTYLYARPGASNDPKNVNAPPASLGNHRDNNFTFQNPFVGPGQLPFPPPPPFNPFGLPPPFLNGSLDNSNITDFFDEDDPSFYYPPPYSFVYKNNYTNPVEPGPLVPGIILPPPPNFFGRLEEKQTKITTTAKPMTSTISTTTTSTTQRPYKQVLRPVYRPTTTTIIPVTQIPTAKSLKSHKVQTEAFRQNVLSPTRLPTPITTQKSVTQLKEINGQEILQFIPKEAILKDPLSGNKGKPIYYEYFDARIKANVNGPVLPTTVVTPSSTVRPLTQQQKQQATKTQLNPSAKQLRRPSNAYLPVKPPSDYEKYVVITPKPESKPNAISTNTVQIGDSQKYKTNSNVAPTKSYNTEIDNIRHTIAFFKNQQNQKQNDSSLPRNPKSKAVFEYSFDSAPQKTSKLFQPPTEFDSSPFKPMVQYSLPLNAENGFKAIAYTTVPTAATEAITKTTTTTTAKPSSAPVSVSNLRYIPTLNSGVSKKPAAVQFIPFDSTPVKPNSLKSTQYSTVSPTTPLPISSVQPYISIEKQILREVQPKEINVQIQTHSPAPRPISLLRGIAAPYESSYVDTNVNDGHYNNHIYYPIRTPSTYYQQPQRPVMTAQQNAYLRQIEAIRQKLQHFPNQYHINVANNTIPSHNYRVPRPLGTQNNFVSSYQFDSNRFPHLSQILSPNYNIHPQQQRLPPAIHPLHRDVLVNYKYPLPPIDPDSEFLPPPHLLQPLPPAAPSPPYNPSTPPYNRYGRLIRKPATVVQYKLPGDQQAGVFFYTPAEEKYGNAKK